MPTIYQFIRMNWNTTICLNKTHTINKDDMKITVYNILLLILVILVSCEDKNVDGDFVTAEVFPFSMTLEKDTEHYGLWLEIIDKADMRASLNSFGQFTFFVPNNEAVTAWLGSNSIDNLTKEEAVTLVRNHMVNEVIESVDYREGCVQDTNLIGDYLAVSFGDDGFNTIILNHHSTIVHKDIELLNGVMHEVDQVIAPHQETVYDYVVNTSQLSILKEALQQTGLIDKLKVIEEVNKYDITRRKYNTVMAIADTTFNRLGIQSYDDLKAKYSTESDVTDKNNGLNKWVRYHVLYGAYFTSSMLDYDEMADAVNLESYCLGEGIQITESRGRIRINYNEVVDGEEVTEEYTSILKEQRNIPMKNGCVQYVNTLLDITPLKPAWVDFDPTNVNNTSVLPHWAANKAWVYSNWIYDEVEPGEIEEWNWETFPEQTTMRYVICNGWFYNNAAVWFDIGNNDGGYFEVESPLVAKGKYRIKVYDRRWKGGGTFKIYIDGKYITTQNQYYGAGDIIGAPAWINGIEFEDTKKHTFRIEYKEGNSGFIFGRVSFEPV
ncbi:fasciclin domain-containing protein [Puteibacter caeruleilacunae]|nr:fasciclin domain-containing protein [Puteibacter caeruleilacunae]